MKSIAEGAKKLRMGMAVALSSPMMAFASGGDSGTGAVGEMEITGSQLMLVLGGVVLVGIALWLVIKLMNK
ncbi:hypothetical protein [Niveibacterium sp.]|uniref:hypothetical protein n=1 Tax=Niveibacterium sp. TaxID=2017444 RepID=UPI0035B371E5